MDCPKGYEICFGCGGQGFISAESFGEQGWHSCYKCAELGYLPEGSLAEYERQSKEPHDITYSQISDHDYYEE